MAIDVTRLDAALGVIVEGNDRLERRGMFVDASGYLTLKYAYALSRGNTTEALRLERVRNPLNFISRDVWDIETLLERLDWLRGMWGNGTLNDGVWHRYVALDIDLFHVVIRSIFDYAAMIFVIISGKEGQLPIKKTPHGEQSSFESLRQWAATNGKRIGALAGTISDCEWFELLRYVRDATVHGSGQTMVFFEKSRILFQVMENHKERHNFLLRMPGLMYNDNVMDFELYAGLIYGYLLDFLEKLALHVFTWIDPASENWRRGGGLHTHPGLSVGKRWIEAARKAGESRDDEAKG